MRNIQILYSQGQTHACLPFHPTPLMLHAVHLMHTFPLVIKNSLPNYINFNKMKSSSDYQVTQKVCPHLKTWKESSENQWYIPNHTEECDIGFWISVCPWSYCSSHQFPSLPNESKSVLYYVLYILPQGFNRFDGKICMREPKRDLTVQIWLWAC